MTDSKRTRSTTVVRIDRELHKQLRIEAAKAGVTVQDLACEAVREKLGLRASGEPSAA